MMSVLVMNSCLTSAGSLMTTALPTTGIRMVAAVPYRRRSHCVARRRNPTTPSASTHGGSLGPPGSRGAGLVDTELAAPSLIGITPPRGPVPVRTSDGTASSQSRQACGIVDVVTAATIREAREAGVTARSRLLAGL